MTLEPHDHTWQVARFVGGTKDGKELWAPVDKGTMRVLVCKYKSDVPVMEQYVMNYNDAIGKWVARYSGTKR